jgi:hypothetical protein
MVQGSEFRVQGSGFREGKGGSGFRMQGVYLVEEEEGAEEPRLI